jgi:ABC-type branched-subunit amino acid transport system ATPase component
MGERSAAQYVEVNDNEVKIVNKGLLDKARRLVAVIGPTGAGKSTMCNTLYHIAFGTNDSFFEPRHATSLLFASFLLSGMCFLLLLRRRRFQLANL